MEKIICDLLHPSEEFTPIPFWFLNDELDKTELTCQLEDFKEKGIDGVVLHPRIGIPKSLPYLSPVFLDVMEHIVRTASELAMTVVLYDEGMYPSGSAHGEVVKTNPAFASLGITLTEDCSKGKVLAAWDDGKYLVQRPTGGTIRGIHFGEDDGETDAPPSADILNPEAVRTFLRLTHERYYARLKQYFGTTIIGFFTDEPCVLGRGVRGYFEWTDGLDGDLVAAGGKLSELRALFEKKGNATTELYRKLIGRRLNDAYYRQLQAWCQDHGVALMGHPQNSDDVEALRFFDVPGQDLVWRSVSPERGGLKGHDSVQAKCSADASRHSVKRRNSNECLGVCSKNGIPWYLTAVDMKWYFVWLGVWGVYFLFPHAFYYSLRGKRKDERPPDVGPNNIWWKHYRLFSDYIKRISYIMCESANCAKTAVLCEDGNVPVEEVEMFYEAQVEFNYLPMNLLNQAFFAGGALEINGYRYTSYMSRTPVDLPIPRILSAGDLPGRDMVPDQFCRNLRVTHLIKYGVHMYFLVNEGEESIHCEALFPMAGNPLAFDLWNGTLWTLPAQTEDGGQRISVDLQRRESRLFLFDPSETVSAPCLPNPKSSHDLRLDLRMIHNDPSFCQKTYTAQFHLAQVLRDETIRIKAEEMAECYCNGSFVGVSFWNPHVFDVGRYLKTGENEIRILITGNSANRFSDQQIPYGIVQDGCGEKTFL